MLGLLLSTPNPITFIASVVECFAVFGEPRISFSSFRKRLQAFHNLGEEGKMTNG